MTMLTNVVSKGHSKRSDKSDRQSRSDQKSKSSRSSHREGGETSSAPSVRFLFVVNELHLNPDFEYTADKWYNSLPPPLPYGFLGETASRVMRYRNGVVSEATECAWRRPQFVEGVGGHPGSVMYTGQDGQLYDAELYKAFSIFSSNPFLPFVVIEGDPSVQGGLEQHTLLFFHPLEDHLRGLSQAVTENSPMSDGGGPVKYVAGRHPSWIPSLVPSTYANPVGHAPLSAGLGGELPIVLGLMAFSMARGRPVEEAFLSSGDHRGRWRGGYWHHNEAPRGYSNLATHPAPRGFFVAVFLDPYSANPNPQETLDEFEWNGAIVREGTGGSSSKR